MINLTQHAASPEQIEEGVIEPQDKREVQDLLTFSSLPTQIEIVERAYALADLAEKAGATSALIGGAPFLMAALERHLLALEISPVYAFSVRESADAVQKRLNSEGGSFPPPWICGGEIMKYQSQRIFSVFTSDGKEKSLNSGLQIEGSDLLKLASGEFVCASTGQVNLDQWKSDPKYYDLRLFPAVEVLEELRIEIIAAVANMTEEEVRKCIEHYRDPDISINLQTWVDAYISPEGEERWNEEGCKLSTVFRQFVIAGNAVSKKRADEKKESSARQRKREANRKAWRKAVEADRFRLAKKAGFTEFKCVTRSYGESPDGMRSAYTSTQREECLKVDCPIRYKLKQLISE